MSQFTQFLEIFGQKKCFFGSTSAPLHGKYCILYLLRFADLRITLKNYAFVAKIEYTCLTKICMAIFAFDKGLPTSATLTRTKACFVFFLVAPLLLSPSSFFPGRESLPPDLKVFLTKRVFWDQPIPQHALTPPSSNCTILCTLRP